MASPPSPVFVENEAIKDKSEKQDPPPPKQQQKRKNNNNSNSKQPIKQTNKTKTIQKRKEKKRVKFNKPNKQTNIRVFLSNCKHTHKQTPSPEDRHAYTFIYISSPVKRGTFAVVAHKLHYCCQHGYNDQQALKHKSTITVVRIRK